MKKFMIIWYILIAITLPAAVVLLSGNIVLRIPETYVYYFNDSQVVDDMGGYIEGDEYADSIAAYFNSPSRKEFQVYETNGDFRDPVFDEQESNVMGKAKNVMTWTLITGIVLMAASLTLYIYLSSNISKRMLRAIGFISLGTSALAIIVSDILISKQHIRDALYGRFIGIPISKDSTVRILLGTPFEKTFIIFSTVLAVAIILIMGYIHQYITREKRLFS